MGQCKKAAAGASFLMILQLAVSSVAKLPVVRYNNSGAGLAVYALSFLLPVFIYIKFLQRAPVSYKRLSVGKIPPAKDCILYITAAVSVTMLAALANGMFTSMLELLGITVQPSSLTPGYGVNGILFTITVSVFLPALLEELLCRYAVMGLLMPCGKVAAAVASGVMFGLMHTNPSQIIYATVSGCLIGYFVATTNSISLGILIHGAINSISLLFLYAEGGNSSESFMSTYILLQIIIIALGLVSLVIIIYKSRKGREERKVSDIKAIRTILLSPVTLLYAAAAIVLTVWRM